MGDELKNIIKNLKKYTNEERCFWLLNNYPLNSENYYLAFQLIPHFSWGKKKEKH